MTRWTLGGASNSTQRCRVTLVRSAFPGCSTLPSLSSTKPMCNRNFLPGWAVTPAGDRRTTQVRSPGFSTCPRLMWLRGVLTDPSGVDDSGMPCCKPVEDRLCGNAVRVECGEHEAPKRPPQDQLRQERSPMRPAGMVDNPVIHALAVQRRHHL